MKNALFSQFKGLVKGLLKPKIEAKISQIDYYGLEQNHLYNCEENGLNFVTRGYDMVGLGSKMISWKKQIRPNKHLVPLKCTAKIVACFLSIMRNPPAILTKLP